MKYIIFSLLILISTLAFTQKSSFKLLDSKYSYNSTESTTTFKRLILLNDKKYYIEGQISFDDEGRTIQKIIKYKKNASDKTIEYKDYTPMLDGFDKMAFIQFLNADENQDKIKLVESRIIKELERTFAATSNAELDFGNGVAIVEYFINNSNSTFQIIYNILKEEKMIDNVLIGQRVYMDGDDYNFEILYPLNYEGTFWGFI